MRKDFASTRRSVTAVAAIGGSVTLIALILMEVFRAFLPNWLYAAATNILGVLFGLAVVSIVWEFFVRRDHSADLRHYLRLGSSVAKSGLQDVLPRSKLDWQQILSSANEVSVLTHNSEWLDRNVYLLRDAAKSRAIRVTVAVPVKGGEYLEREARRRDMTSEALADSIAEVAMRSVRLWREAKQDGQAFHKDSALRVVEHPFDLGYEVVTVDRTTIVTLAAPGDSREMRDRVAFVYEQSAEEYPTLFFLSYKPILKDLTALDEA